MRSRIGGALFSILAIGALLIRGAGAWIGAKDDRGAPGEPKVLRGQVVTLLDAHPIEGAAIRIHGSTLRAKTDAAGRFVIDATDLPHGIHAVTTSALGFRPIDCDDVAIPGPELRFRLDAPVNIRGEVVRASDGGRVMPSRIEVEVLTVDYARARARGGRVAMHAWQHPWSSVIEIADSGQDFIAFGLEPAVVLARQRTSHANSQIEPDGSFRIHSRMLGYYLLVVRSATDGMTICGPYLCSDRSAFVRASGVSGFPRLEVSVRDAMSDRPLTNAVATIYFEGGELREFVDELGLAAFSSIGDTVTLLVEAPGHAADMRVVAKPGSAGASRVDVALRPSRARRTIVRYPNGAPAAACIVRVTPSSVPDGPYSRMFVTDADGEFHLPDFGSVDYRVEIERNPGIYAREPYPPPDGEASGRTTVLLDGDSNSGSEVRVPWSQPALVRIGCAGDRYLESASWNTEADDWLRWELVSLGGDGDSEETVESGAMLGRTLACLVEPGRYRLQIGSRRIQLRENVERFEAVGSPFDLEAGAEIDLLAKADLPPPILIVMPDSHRGARRSVLLRFDPMPGHGGDDSAFTLPVSTEKPLFLLPPLTREKWQVSILAGGPPHAFRLADLPPFWTMILTPLLLSLIPHGRVWDR